MKNPRRSGRKLTLQHEHIRVLGQIELGQVDGGDPASSLCPTHRFCTLACAR